MQRNVADVRISETPQTRLDRYWPAFWSVTVAADRRQYVIWHLSCNGVAESAQVLLSHKLHLSMRVLLSMDFSSQFSAVVRSAG
jgi:hypothetical protein